MPEKNLKYLITIVVSSVLFMSCNTDTNISTVRIQEQSSDFKSDWNELVIDSTNIDLNKSGINKTLSTLTHIGFLSSGDLVIPDGYEKTITIIDQRGEVIKKISKNGRGPGEFQIISRINIDENDNIYLFDPSQKKMIVYESPSYNSFQEYLIKSYISRFEILSSPLEIVTYSPYTEYLFNKINLRENRVIESAIIPSDEKYKIWMSRIQSGGLVYNRNKNSIYGLYPQDLVIYEFSPSLSVKAKIVPKSNKEFYKKFPENLDPYDHNLHHEYWWQEFNHLSRIKLIGNDKILITYYGKSKTNETSKVYVNIYDLSDKNIIAENVELPEKANVAGINNGNLYVSYRAHLDENSDEVPFQLIKYSLNGIY